MNAAVVKRTQEALGRVIRKPPLTEKLLSKPPFRYLHDIITEVGSGPGERLCTVVTTCWMCNEYWWVHLLKEVVGDLRGEAVKEQVIRVTGFMKGLYTDAEMKSENVKDKDGKISFLQKAIDVVVLVSGEPVSAKPARIVAGHEPERTNELLQRIGKCCLSKLSSEDAVKRVLAGEKGDVKGRASLTSRPQDADSRHAREEEPRAPREKEGRSNSEINEGSTSRDRKQKEDLKEESKSRERGGDKEKTRENDRDRQKDPERDKFRDEERERLRARARPDRDRDRANRDRDRDRANRDRDRDLDRVRERKNAAGKEQERWKDREKERERDKGRDRDRDRDRRRARDGEQARDPSKAKSREHEKAEKKSSSSGEVSKKLPDGPFQDSKAEAETEISTRASRPMATKTSKERPKVGVEGDSPRDADCWLGAVPSEEVGPVIQDKPEVSANSEGPAELPAGMRRIPRPGSARPAPPRVSRQDSAEVFPADRTGSGQAVSNVIVDVQNSDNEEDDQFVVEAAPQQPELSERDVVQAVGLEEDEKHGGLVKKILETKKDYERLRLSPKPGEKEKSLVLESAWKKEKDVVSKEIEKLRVSIQTLCKSALPLGKIMDYLQEDADAMQNELQLWHRENLQHAEALRQEQSITDGTVEPLKAELLELEQLIRDQQDKICAVKADILKNEERIQKMVRSISTSSRR
ncbi:TRAF3-interacting protein 1 [Molossus molossus]|uniref:TRAF3-interacting protein 1 n=1 Tax=Molossus molossus TaxID=27622 RepID=UPI0017470C4C|nr:TRAF3-interacting protein 1 [Molossus molossus]